MLRLVNSIQSSSSGLTGLADAINLACGCQSAKAPVPTLDIELAIGEACQSLADFLTDEAVPSARRLEVAAWAFETMRSVGQDLLWQIEDRLAEARGLQAQITRGCRPRVR